MSFGMFRLLISAFLTLYQVLLHKGIQANTLCNQVSSSQYYISSKDFVVSRHDPKYVMCAAYFCSYTPAIMPLQLTVNAINDTADNIIVHLEKKSISFRNKCGNCFEDTGFAVKANSRTKRTDGCMSCPKIEFSKGIEVHVRLKNTGDIVNSESNLCNWDINFNMTIQEFSCEDGKYSINMPMESNCSVTFATPTQLICSKPTCSQDIIFKNTSDKFIHKFVTTSDPQTCIWRLDIEPHKKMNLSFSPSIRNYLYIFEGNLLFPKLQLGTCNSIIGISEITLEPADNSVYIVYYNNNTLENDGFLEILHKDNICNLPSFIENGKIEFVQDVNDTKALFTCNENYHLIGEDQLYCSSHKDLPICTSIDKLVSDEPDLMKSNTSIIELDKIGEEFADMLSENLTMVTVVPEGSGQSYPDYDSNLKDDIDVNDPDGDEFQSGNPSTALANITKNLTLARNKTFIHPWQSDGKLVLFSLSNLQDNMFLFIIIGVAVLLIVIITVISIIVYKNRSLRSGLNRKFDTFQNPIYEKPVIRVPITSSSESDPSQEKLDLGDLSDSTVLD